MEVTSCGSFFVVIIVEWCQSRTITLYGGLGTSQVSSGPSVDVFVFNMSSVLTLCDSD